MSHILMSICYVFTERFLPTLDCSAGICAEPTCNNPLPPNPDMGRCCSTCPQGMNTFSFWSSILPGMYIYLSNIIFIRKTRSKLACRLLFSKFLFLYFYFYICRCFDSVMQLTSTGKLNLIFCFFGWLRPNNKQMKNHVTSSIISRQLVL